MKYILLIFSIIMYGNAFSQQADELKTLYYSDNGVEIFIKPTDCINSSQGTAKQYLFLEIVNNNSNEITISFKKELWYNNVCNTCGANTNENESSVIVLKNSRISGGCEVEDKQLSLFSRMLDLDNVRVLTKYELKNITIENNN